MAVTATSANAVKPTALPMADAKEGRREDRGGRRKERKRGEGGAGWEDEPSRVGRFVVLYT